MKKVAKKPIKKKAPKKTKSTPSKKKTKTFRASSVRRSNRTFRAKAGLETPIKTKQKKLPFGLVSPVNSPTVKAVPSPRK